MIKYDLVVIGAGSGGLVAATTANRKGLKVALLEKNKIGGECTHSGCIPSKAFIYSAKMFGATKHLKENYGLEGFQIKGELNFSTVMERVENIVKSTYDKETPDIFEKEGIDVFVNESGAKFIDANTVQIGKHVINFTQAVICTGSSPRQIKLEGSSDVHFLNNENFWLLRELPESVIFIGGGIISAELGQALVRFGSKVTILDRNPEILKPVDPDARKIITEIFKKEGITIIRNAEPKKIKNEDKVSVVSYVQNNVEIEIAAEKIFISVGRKPNVSGMELQNAGIVFSEKGIRTNSFLQTNVPHIFACGDVASEFKFTHAAAYQAEICIENILEINNKKSVVTPMPWVIFTDPEIAHVGLSETEALRIFGDNFSVFKVDAVMDRFVTDASTTGFLKVLFDSDNLVIGADAIGSHAGEWIQFLTVAIKNKITAESFADTIFAYPTYSEIVKKAFTRFLRSQK